ncbi:5-demethoxyubiquinone hydroxylase, mitochondrial [Monosporozyma unispora]|nr:Catabolite repression protein cat5 [Kazachstania unispora]
MLRPQLNNNVTRPVRCFSALAGLNASTKAATNSTTPKDKEQLEPLSPAQKAYLERAIRVDQAGELGADYIYRGQIFVLTRKYPHLRPILNHMWEQEVHHRATFNELQLKHRVRPSLITPLWKMGAIAMGAGTALISREAAMACTEAVETVIGGHYNEQLRVLNNQYEQKHAGGKGKATTPEEIKSLIATIKEFRDQELEHLDTAIQNNSRMAVPYMLITEGIKGVCKLAIWSAERI